MTATVDRARLDSLVARERVTYRDRHPGSLRVFEDSAHLLGRVPMTWMTMWAGGFPIAFAGARGNRITDVDGNTFVDFALGDTGAMAGHSPAATLRAVHERIDTLGGITTMLPSEDGEQVAAELARRFGVPSWTFTLSATDANRWAARLARLVTGRTKLLVFSYCYHGTVDETFVVLDHEGRTVSRPGNVGPAVDPALTTRAAQWNDLVSVEQALAHGDVAAVLLEPALTNIGIVLPDDGFLAGVRELATRHGALLTIDETHTLSAGPGGMTLRDSLEPDIVVIGKSIGGGVPCGAYGLSAAMAAEVLARVTSGDADIEDVGGVGGTLAGNALSLAAMRATLGEVLTDAAFETMIATCTRYTAGVQQVIERHDVPWSVVQLGARAEYRFAAPAPRSGNESAAAADETLDEYLHLYTANRGVLMTPFHNMALMCPDTTDADVDLHTAIFDEAVGELVG